MKTIMFSIVFFLPVFVFSQNQNIDTIQKTFFQKVKFIADMQGSGINPTINDETNNMKFTGYGSFFANYSPKPGVNFGIFSLYDPFGAWAEFVPTLDWNHYFHDSTYIEFGTGVGLEIDHKKTNARSSSYILLDASHFELFCVYEKGLNSSRNFFYKGYTIYKEKVSNRVTVGIGLFAHKWLHYGPMFQVSVKERKSERKFTYWLAFGPGVKKENSSGGISGGVRWQN